MYALVRHTGDWDQLQAALGGWLTVHSILMIVAGVALGIAVLRASVLPRWTGLALIAGMVLMAVTAGLPDVIRTFAAGVRDLAFAGMGMALLRHAPRSDGRRRQVARTRSGRTRRPRRSSS